MKQPHALRRRSAPHREGHRSGRGQWLRAAVLGSDDAIVSTASLMIGVAAASASQGAILVAGVAGLVAGSMSMAVGEYVSVSSQRDAEKADIARETQELATQPAGDRYLLPDVMLSRGCFLDGETVAVLPRPVEIVETDGAALVRAVSR